jgi:5'(3')-deoxyribonucleotidase
MNQNHFVIGLDVDGVLRNWTQTILQQVNAIYNTRFFNQHIITYDFTPIIKQEVPGFNREVLEGIHKRCAETGKLAEASAYKDGLTLFHSIFEAGFPIRLLTCQPVWARKSFYDWIKHQHLKDKIVGIDFMEPEAKAEAKVQLFIDDNLQVIETAVKKGKPSVLWQRTWNRDWKYPGADLPEDFICHTARPRKAVLFINRWEERLSED